MVNVDFELRSAIYQLLAADEVVRAAMEKIVEIHVMARLEERSTIDVGD